MNRPILDIKHADINVTALRSALNQTPHDHHFGADFRFRSMSRFEITDGDPPFRRLDKYPLYQSSGINPIENYGGIYRDYGELPDALTDSPEFIKVVRLWIESLPAEQKTFSVHHIRTLAPGAPTPEGRHRDGYEYVGIGVMQRRGIDAESAVTRIWDRESKDLVLERALQEGDLVVFDDRKHLHSTSDVELARQCDDGVRDVLIFTVPDHAQINESYEVQ